MLYIIVCRPRDHPVQPGEPNWHHAHAERAGGPHQILRGPRRRLHLRRDLPRHLLRHAGRDGPEVLALRLGDQLLQQALGQGKRRSETRPLIWCFSS